ncbi:hypothetical protein C8F01DRAFT_1094451 [Mycena amicta]|nr:hypothetical protein C8F01DRAFT_1094451 [Mycena amicta]
MARARSKAVTLAVAGVVLVAGVGQLGSARTRMYARVDTVASFEPGWVWRMGEEYPTESPDAGNRGGCGGRKEEGSVTVASVQRVPYDYSDPHLRLRGGNANAGGGEMTSLATMEMGAVLTLWQWVQTRRRGRGETWLRRGRARARAGCNVRARKTNMEADGPSSTQPSGILIHLCPTPEPLLSAVVRSPPASPLQLSPGQRLQRWVGDCVEWETPMMEVKSKKF